MSYFRNSKHNYQQQGRHSQRDLNECGSTTASIKARIRNMMIKNERINDITGIIIQQEDDIVCIIVIDQLKCFSYQIKADINTISIQNMHCTQKKMEIIIS